jgi:FixJ family two-component response regulator
LSGTTPTVFIVDDEASVRKALCRLLDSAGFATASFASAAEFLAEHDPAQPGCLLLDLSMPGLTGLELQQALLARGAPPPSSSSPVTPTSRTPSRR